MSKTKRNKKVPIKSCRSALSYAACVYARRRYEVSSDKYLLTIGVRPLRPRSKSRRAVWSCVMDHLMQSTLCCLSYGDFGAAFVAEQGGMFCLSSINIHINLACLPLLVRRGCRSWSWKVHERKAWSCGDTPHVRRRKVTHSKRYFDCVYTFKLRYNVCNQ